MAEYRLSIAATRDIDEIYTYSFQKFGEIRADTYLLSLDATLRLLAGHPSLGRPARLRIPDLYRHGHYRHVIFYQVRPSGIFVVRILHQSMDVRRHISPPLEPSRVEE